nr:MAG TPA: hypothetical protein [Caudoviricetes sp.]
MVRNTGDFSHRGSAACGRTFIEGRDSDCC